MHSLCRSFTKERRQRAACVDGASRWGILSLPTIQNENGTSTAPYPELFRRAARLAARRTLRHHRGGIRRLVADGPGTSGADDWRSWRSRVAGGGGDESRPTGGNGATVRGRAARLSIRHRARASSSRARELLTRFRWAFAPPVFSSDLQNAPAVSRRIGRILHTHAMDNPKQALTSFTRLYQAKAAPTQSRAPAFGSFAATLAEANVVRESDADALSRLPQEYSIHTIEELAALARIDAKRQTHLLKDMGLPTTMGKRMLDALKETGKEVLADMERYERLEYTLGCELDFSKPPSPTNPFQPATVGGVIFGAPPPGGQPPPPPAAVNLINAQMPAIKDQADRGTCVAFTTVACLEYHLSRFGQQAGLDLSEQFQYWNMVNSTGQRNLVSGYPLLAGSGVCREKTWPYYGKDIPGDDIQGPPPATVAAEAAAYRCTQVRQLPAQSVSTIQEELRRDGSSASASPYTRAGSRAESSANTATSPSRFPAKSRIQSAMPSRWSVTPTISIMQAAVTSSCATVGTTTGALNASSAPATGRFHIVTSPITTGTPGVSSAELLCAEHAARGCGEHRRSASRFAVERDDRPPPRQCCRRRRVGLQPCAR